MRELLSFCPSGPDWQVPWAALDERYEWIRRMADCPQDANYHSEGNVWIHTRMVCEELTALPGFRALPEAERQLVFLASLLHDVAKPDCTKHEDDGRITSKGHSGRGERLVRGLLWELGADMDTRETVARLVRVHQVPFFLIDDDQAVAIAYRLSLTVRCDMLSLVAEADARGRRCKDPADQQRMLDNVELFRELCREHDCLDKPRVFPSNHARFEYFRKAWRDPNYNAYDDTDLEVIVMCGLPAAGKDTWIRENVLAKAPDTPVVSLDSIRAELGVSPGDNQSPVIKHAREQARICLRAKQTFVWNATNLIRDHRNAIVDLCVDYNARVLLVYVDAAETTLRSRNAAREDSVPSRALNRMIERWTVPDPAEAHEVCWIQAT